MNTSHQKKLLFYFFIVIFNIIIIEIFSQFAYKYIYGDWHHIKNNAANSIGGVKPANSSFPVLRSNNTRVKDKRYFTLTRNTDTLNKAHPEGYYNEWNSSIDSFGFRNGSHVTDRKCTNMVFLGDSVPFGWGVNDADTLPSRYSSYLSGSNTKCVINAAVPSYSLFQSIEKFKIEIYKKYVVKDLFIQTYDPVSQYAIFGRLWNKDINWATWRAWASNKWVGQPSSENITHISAALQLLHQLYDEVIAIANYSDEITKSLHELDEMSKEMGVEKLVLAPVTTPGQSWENFTVRRKIAIVVFNKTLLNYSQMKDNVYYLDTIKLLESYDESVVFLDKCCHLTPKGNEIIAEALYGLIQNSNKNE